MGLWPRPTPSGRPGSVGELRWIHALGAGWLVVGLAVAETAKIRRAGPSQRQLAPRARKILVTQCPGPKQSGGLSLGDGHEEWGTRVPNCERGEPRERIGLVVIG